MLSTGEFLVRSELCKGSLTLAFLALAAGESPITAQPPNHFGLPSTAVVIEEALIPESIRPNRRLVLWMLSPQRHDRGEFSESDH